MLQGRVVGTTFKMQEDTLQVLRDYLQTKHMKKKHKDFPNE
jgi:hypothetical protein